MLFRRFLFVAAAILLWSSSFAQIQGEIIQSRILILLDRSSSMIQPWAGGNEKYKAADQLILRLMDSVYKVNPEVQFGLRVFGHQSTVEENNCFDSKIEVSFSTDNRIQMGLRLEDIKPLGVTAIAYSLKESAMHDLVDEAHNIYSIILITDGGESCGGDICEVMRTLINNKVFFKPYILNLEDSPPLRAAYACMGDYLQVVKNEDIQKAVGVIVQAFKPALRATSADYDKIQAVATNAPSALKVTVPVNLKVDNSSKVDITPKVDNTRVSIELDRLSQSGQQTLPIYSRPDISIPPVKLPTIVAAPIADEPRINEKMNTIGVGSLKTINIKSSTPQPIQQIGIEPIVINAPEPDHVPDDINKISLRPTKTLLIMYVSEDHAMAARRLPPMPVIKYDASILAAPPVPPGDKPVDFTSESIDSKETSLEVVFTNGKGKFFTTTPQVVLLDPVTKKVVKKFFRTVDPDGNADPQTNIPVGTYDISLTARASLVVHNVVIEPNKKKRVVITVKPSSISFAYDNAPKRPVKEFSAVVIERNVPNGRVQNQKCTDRLEYDPGNYHLEINTFPKEVRNVDIDFDETVITLPQPGFAKFTHDGKIRTVQLYQRFGDKFMNFYTLELDNPISKHLMIQPGEYQAHYQKGTSTLHATEQVVQFLVKPTLECEVIIK